MNLKLDTLKAENKNNVSDVSKKVATAVKTAVKVATVKEITHHLKDKEVLKKTLGNKYIEEQCKVASLQIELIHAKRIVHNSSKEATTQQSNSLDIVNNLNITMANNKILEERVIDLGYSVEEGEKLLSQAEALVPIRVIEKKRVGKYGAPVWPFYMHELVMEQIVNGTPPSSINSNMVVNVRIFSPGTIIKDLPSIWTIQYTRTVLLIIVQTLAAY